MFPRTRASASSSNNKDLGGFDNFASLDAASANAQMGVTTTNSNVDALQIWVKAPLGAVVRV